MPRLRFCMGHPIRGGRLFIIPFIVLTLQPKALGALPLEGYLTETSLRNGDTLELHVRSEHATYHLSVLQQRARLMKIGDLGEWPGHHWSIPDSAWLGCNWPVTNRVIVPESWRPGAYLAHLVAGTDSTRIPFAVRARIPGSVAPILVQLSTNTWQAYNRYGGKSLYGAYAAGLSGRATHVSFQRPFKGPYGDTEYALLWDYPFISFLETEGYLYEVCTNLDVHREPGLLDSYRLFLSVGHDEYYSKEMFDELERYANSGGSLAFFSANTLWWQVRYEDAGQTMVCFKSAKLDPLLHVDDARVTVNWHARPVLRPPAALMGVYYNGSMGIPVGPYKVYDPGHWTYEGVQVSAGQEFGYPMVGFEVDARTSNSPANLEVIARNELPDSDNGGVLRTAEMVYHELSGGGAVFACGTVNYVQGIVPYYNPRTGLIGQADPIARTVTNNVLRRLSTGATPDARLRNVQTSFRVVYSGGDRFLEVTAPTPGIVFVYDIRGRRVVEFAPVAGETTRYELCPNCVASGIYFATFRGTDAGGRSDAQRLCILK